MKTALVTGANRGIGLEFVKQLSAQGMQVFACCRNPEQAKALQALAAQQQGIRIYQLDVSDQQQLDKLADDLEDTPIDWVINNAGISGDSGVSVGNFDRDNFLHVMNVNCVSVGKVSEAFLSSLIQGQDKLIVAISSRMGSISDNDSGKSYAYRSSKAALHCLMRSFALDVANDGIKVMLLHPGWVQTDMGGSKAPLELSDSVRGMLQQIKTHKDNTHAEVLRRFDGDTIAW